jgi:hypothetical protein
MSVLSIAESIHGISQTSRARQICHGFSRFNPTFHCQTHSCMIVISFHHDCNTHVYSYKRTDIRVQAEKRPLPAGETLLAAHTRLFRGGAELLDKSCPSKRIKRHLKLQHALQKDCVSPSRHVMVVVQGKGQKERQPFF